MLRAVQFSFSSNRSSPRAYRTQYFTVDYNSCDDNDTLLFPSDESIIAGPMGLSGETGREEENEAEEEEIEEEQEGRL